MRENGQRNNIIKNEKNETRIRMKLWYVKAHKQQNIFTENKTNQNELIGFSYGGMEQGLYEHVINTLEWFLFLV